MKILQIMPADNYWLKRDLGRGITTANKIICFALVDNHLYDDSNEYQSVHPCIDEGEGLKIIKVGLPESQIVYSSKHLPDFDIMNGAI